MKSKLRRSFFIALNQDTQNRIDKKNNFSVDMSFSTRTDSYPNLNACTSRKKRREETEKKNKAIVFFLLLTRTLSIKLMKKKHFLLEKKSDAQKCLFRLL